MTRKEFIAAYCERSSVSWKWLSTEMVALPCACGGDLCEGWAMVSNDPLSIRTHEQLYAPKAKREESRELPLP